MSGGPMTVADLIAELMKLPGESRVVILDRRGDDGFGLWVDPHLTHYGDHLEIEGY